MWTVVVRDLKGVVVAQRELKSGSLSFGREVGRDFVLPSKAASRKHARIDLLNGAPFIVDEGSANGTLVNGVIIKGPTPLNESSRVEIAEFIVSMVKEEEPDADATVLISSKARANLPPPARPAAPAAPAAPSRPAVTPPPPAPARPAPPPAAAAPPSTGAGTIPPRPAPPPAAPVGSMTIPPRPTAPPGAGTIPPRGAPPPPRPVPPSRPLAMNVDPSSIDTTGMDLVVPGADHGGSRPAAAPPSKSAAPPPAPSLPGAAAPAPGTAQVGDRIFFPDQPKSGGPNVGSIDPESITAQLDRQISSIRNFRDQAQGDTQTKLMRVEMEWKQLVTSMQALKQRFAGDKRVLSFNISRDEKEVALKIADPHDKRGYRYFLLSRHHPEGKVSSADVVWLREFGRDDARFDEPKKAMEELFLRIAGNLA